MTQLLVHVEGQTEETFVNEVLAPHLHGFGLASVSARLFGNARQRSVVVESGHGAPSEGIS